MKTIEKIRMMFSDEVQPRVELLTFRHATAGHTLKRKGYAIYIKPGCGSNNVYEEITIEPVNYSDGDKWFVYGPRVRRYSGPFYAKNIQEVYRKLLKAFR